MFRNVRFQHFKSLRDFSIGLKQVNVLVGPNNAGKSTILDAFRILAAAARLARRRNPWPVTFGGETVMGYQLMTTQVPISLANIHSDYQEVETSAAFTLNNGNKLRLAIRENAQCVLTLQNDGPPVNNTGRFRSYFPADISCFPTLGPLEEDEELLTDEYVEQWRGSRRAHRMFRNIWHRQRDRFPAFQRLVEETWPGMSIQPPEVHGYGRRRLSMFCKEGRVDRELCWAGFGFQVWLQLLTHLESAGPATTLVIDEPEIYLHPDLQHRLFQLLRSSGRQIILATHSSEIVNEAEQDEVVLVNRSRRSARRITDIDGLQEALFSIGSVKTSIWQNCRRHARYCFLRGRNTAW